MKRNRFTYSYIRFHNQLKALQKGKIRIVKKIAREARHELEMKSNLSQLKLHMLYEN